jgi:putative endopeptidase
MPPQVVNAYFMPPANEIVFPAAILQPPFFNLEADDAVNYGAIGAIIAHEITHGFDDQGRKYDAKGNLKDWWTKTDDKKFKERANIIIQQYNAYYPQKDLHINGQLTLGENIADLGGLNISLTALRNSLKGKQTTMIGGLTPEQRFFYSFATIWKAKLRPEY